MNRVNRIFAMIYVINNGGRLYPKDLVVETQTSIRTINRDIHDVKRFYKTMFGKNVVRTSIKGITYYEVEK